MSRIVGIDLGTTHSVVAHLCDLGPQLIPNALGHVLTPSVVAVDRDGQVLVGAAAKDLQVTRPELCASLFKRYMGSDWSTVLAGRTFTPEELSSLVLASLKRDAEAFLKEPVTRAVITVPAYFNDQRRKATIHAGQIAGLTVERILNEPTAAALAYGFHEDRSEKVLLIVDLGGGTFDVSLVEFFDGVLEVRASSGESFLGGEDFTRSLAARVLEQHGFPFERTEMEAPLLCARMIQQAENAKRLLARQDSVTLRIPNVKGELPSHEDPVTVTRLQFEKWTLGLLGRIELPIRRVLSDAGLNATDIHEVILGGGATRMPAVAELMQSIFGKRPQQRFNPDEVVALGAAVLAGLVDQHLQVEDMVVTDVAPFTLGVEVTKHFGFQNRDGYFLPIINRNTTIPVSRVERVSTVHANQTEVVVRVFQGEARRVEQNLCLGEFRVTGIPRGPAGQEIDLRFTYDLNGVLEVEAIIVATKAKITHVITKLSHGLTPEQIQTAIQAMQKLKTSPRDDAENRFLLRRAERIYQELNVDQRVVLSQLLDGFEAALASQDKASIEAHREQLKAFLTYCDPDTTQEDRRDV